MEPVSESEEEDEGLVQSPAEKARTRTASGRKVPAGAVSMFGGIGGGNPLAAALSKRRQSSVVGCCCDVVVLGMHWVTLQFLSDCQCQAHNIAIQIQFIE